MIKIKKTLYAHLSKKSVKLCFENVTMTLKLIYLTNIKLHYWSSLQAQVPQFQYSSYLTVFRMGYFQGCSQIGRRGRETNLTKICYTYPTMMKLGTVKPYIKKIQKIFKSCDIHLKFHWCRIFLLEISQFCYIKKYKYRLHFDT